MVKRASHISGAMTQQQQQHTVFSFVQQEVDQNEKVPAGTAHTAAASPHVQLTHLLYTPSPFITLKI